MAMWFKLGFEVFCYWKLKPHVCSQSIRGVWKAFLYLGKNLDISIDCGIHLLWFLYKFGIMDKWFGNCFPVQSLHTYQHNSWRMIVWICALFHFQDHSLLCHLSFGPTKLMQLTLGYLIPVFPKLFSGMNSFW
jgi:hypothetical protein